MPLRRDRPARDHKADQTADENSQSSFPGERPLNTAHLVTLARPLLNASGLLRRTTALRLSTQSGQLIQVPVVFNGFPRIFR